VLLIKFIFCVDSGGIVFGISSMIPECVGIRFFDPNILRCKRRFCLKVDVLRVSFPTQLPQSIILELREVKLESLELTKSISSVVDTSG